MVKSSTSTKSTTAKQVTVLARVQFKNDPRKVVYRCLSSNGKDTYETYFFNGKACGCSCPVTKPCYHMTQCQAKEDARQAPVTTDERKRVSDWCADVERENRNAWMRYQYYSF